MLNKEKVEEKDVTIEEETTESTVTESGDIIIKDDEVTEESESESDEDKSDEDKAEETEESEIEIEPEYQGKSVQDVIKMHKEAVKLYHSHDDELGRLRSNIKTADLSSAEIKERLSAEQIKKGRIDTKFELNREARILADIEEYSDSYNSQKQKVDELQTTVSKLELDYLEKHQDETFNIRWAGSENARFIEKQKEVFKKKGFDLTETEFNNVTERAKNYVNDIGVLTDNAYTHGLIDEFGVEKVTKFMSINEGKKVRNEINRAGEKVDTKVDTSGGGKTAKVKTLKYGTTEYQRWLNNPNTTIEEIQESYKRANK